jgi:cell wall-associated NlpC family hydrolase
MSGERGQIAVAAVGLIVLLAAGAALLVQMSRIVATGAHAQTAADLAALSAARRLAADPSASATALRTAAARAARRNGGRLAGLRIGLDGALPEAVEVSVAMPDGDGHTVTLRSRAGVSYTATLPASGFRPVELAGLGRAAAVVTAAEAQIGWPYVWGGESRAEGGFDCSGLIDYAYAAAGLALPGRPTAADLYRMSSRISESALAPGDLVFMGAPSGAPYHVGMYVGSGVVVAAPHTGAVVSYQFLADGGWDGFGRLLAGQGPVAPPSAVEEAARHWQVPVHVLAASLELRLYPDAETAARAIAGGQARHPGDLERALADALDSGSRAALVLRAASGPALGSGFAGTVRLLPVDGTGAGGGDPGARLHWEAPGAPTRFASRTGGGSLAGTLQGAAGTGSDATDLAGRIADGAAERLPGLPRLSRLLGPLGRGGLSLIAVLSPDRRLADAASFAGAAWDGVSAVAAMVARAEPAMGALARLTAGLGILGGALTAVAGGMGLARARTTRGRIRAAATMASGLLVAGGGLLTTGVLVGAVPPVGLGLIAAGTAIYAGSLVYDHWDGIRSAAGTAVRAAAGLAARTASGVRQAGSAALGGAVRAASAVADAVSSLSPF